MSYAKVMGLCLLVGLAVGMIAGLINAFGGPAAGGLRIALMGLTLTFVLGITLVWWRGADEAVREAHKWAWYWGGTVGIAVGMVVFGLLSWRGVAFTLPPLTQDGPAGYVMTGMALILGLELVGYLVAWAIWWLRHR